MAKGPTPAGQTLSGREPSGAGWGLAVESLV